MADVQPLDGSASRVPWLPVVGLAALKLAVTMVFGDRYGWHRDELYYLASARHLALGYVDYPPVTPAIARLVQVAAPQSVAALRFASVLAGTLVVVLAALAVVISPLFLGANFVFTTVSFDQLAWALLLWPVARVLAGGDPRLWLLAGLALGVGLETKHTIAALAVALAGVCRYMRSVGSLCRGLGRHGPERRAAIAEHRCPITTPARSSSWVASPRQPGDGIVTAEPVS